MAKGKTGRGHLWKARVYLSGPMDFVASRQEEMKFGWRNRVSQFLKRLGVTVFDPWYKPQVRYFQDYGRENPKSQEEIKTLWIYHPARKAQKARAVCAHRFWETLHIDLRMVDTSDFVIAYCPTTIYSVGTVHEIVMARLQRKPVLFVSPRIQLKELDALRKHLETDKRGLDLLKKLEARVPIKPNPNGIPSLWYMPLLNGHSFFDGFGFARFQKQFRWQDGPMDAAERESPPQRPLLPFLLQLNRKKPMRYSLTQDKEVRDDDWLLWKLG